MADAIKVAQLVSAFETWTCHKLKNISKSQFMVRYVLKSIWVKINFTGTINMSIDNGILILKPEELLLEVTRS